MEVKRRLKKRQKIIQWRLLQDEKRKKGMKLLFCFWYWSLLINWKFLVVVDVLTFVFLSFIFFDILYGLPWWNWMSYVIVLGVVCCLSSDNLLSSNQTCTPYQIKPSSSCVFYTIKIQNLITAFDECILLHFDIEVLLIVIQSSVGRFLGSQFSVPMHTAYK